MDDTAIITDADYGVAVGGVLTASIGAGSVTSHGTFYGTTWTPKQLYRVHINAGRTIGVEEVLSEPPKPEAAPKKPPPSLPVEAWATREFDAEQAHAATLALCRGQ